MKEFFRKSWVVTIIEVRLLGYLLIGLPYVMWKIAQVIFEQEDANINADTIIQRVTEGLKDL